MTSTLHLSDLGYTEADVWRLSPAAARHKSDTLSGLYADAERRRQELNLAPEGRISA